MLASIIIPTYNRAALIGETLDSILAQTYTHWECLIIDDGSTDNSEEILLNYCHKDPRFRFLKRPPDRPKGANACRNIGLENAAGDAVVFFDSDDLMTPNHLQVKIDALINRQLDYAITRTEFFNLDTNRLNNYYRFDQYAITPENYLKQRINWLTLDVAIKADLAKSIRFNEQLQSGQEYNYLCKLIHGSHKAAFIDEVVSLRRHHEKSIRSSLDSTRKLQQSIGLTHWHTYLDLQPLAEHKLLKYLLYRVASIMLRQGDFLGISKVKFYQAVKTHFEGWNSILILLGVYTQKYFRRGGYFVSQRLKKQMD